MPLTVEFKAGTRAAQRAASVLADGGQEVLYLAPLGSSIINVPVSSEAEVMASYAVDPLVSSVQAPVVVAKAGTPSDPLYAQQWALPKIGWDQAYASIPVHGSATIAVLDTGVEASVPDLAGRLVGGTSFTGGAATSDPNGHGTEMASIAAGQVNNGSGLAGVAYGAGMRVQPVQVLGSDGTGWDASVAAGVLWAADHGANVMLMAFDSPSYSAVLAAAVSYAESRGVVLVAATGNDGVSTPTYPASLPGVIGVASTDASDHVLASSNTGGVAVAAPGAGIEGLAPGGGGVAVTGTSAAAAEVAGAAALLAAGGRSASYITTQLTATADAVSGQAFGRLNLPRALGPELAGTPTPTGSVTPIANGTPTYVAAASSFRVNITADGTFAGACAAATANECTLREAIIEAEVAGGSISLPAGTYALSAPLPLIIAAAAPVTITGAGSATTIIDGGSLNQASSNILALQSGSLTITGVTITHGTCSACTGGAVSNGASLALANDVIAANSSGAGGGLYNGSGASMTLTEVTVSGNTSTGVGGLGGGIESLGTLTVTDSTISGNSSTSTGGGVDVGVGTATISGSTFTANSAPGKSGAALNLTLGSATITNSTIANNGGGSNGAVFSGVSGGVHLVNDTVAYNQNSGGGVNANVTTQNTLLVNNVPNCTAAVTDLGYSLSDDPTCGFSPANHSLSVSANTTLGPLANNGGPTETMALLSGSPAIDTGGTSANGCPSVDQPGLSRPQGAACDIGAYEAAVPTVSPSAAPGTDGYALRFDGSSTVVHSPASSVWTGAGGVSVSFWMNPSRVGPASSRSTLVVDDANGSAFNGSWLFEYWKAPVADPYQHNLAWELRDATTGALVQASVDVSTLDTWSHITGTYDPISGSAQLYVNGQLAGTCASAASDTDADASADGDCAALTLSGARPVAIGGGCTAGACGDGYFEGLLAHVAVWNRSLSASEVASAAEGTPPTGGLVAHWPLSDGTGTLAANTAGSNPGTISGSVAWASFSPPSLVTPTAAPTPTATASSGGGSAPAAVLSLPSVPGSVAAALSAAGISFTVPPVPS
ncbi:MAG: S8 family serine peptidase, partial [Chloroflexota bacterium]